MLCKTYVHWILHHSNHREPHNSQPQNPHPNAPPIQFYPQARPARDATLTLIEILADL
jgi:hypothetical protein